MTIINIKDQNSLKNAASVLKDGGIFIFPTDTVYGIGCSLNEKAILGLYKVKNRPLNKPTAVLMNQDDIPDILKSAYQKFPLGQVTIISKENNFKIKFPTILLKDNKIGVRIPNDEWLQELLNLVGPIVASSANIGGESTPKCFDEISLELLEQVDLVIKSDQISQNQPSTIFDLEEDKILRN